MQDRSAADQAEALSQLSALLHLTFVGNLQTVPAQVTDFGTSNFAATIDINVGRSDGVQLSMPVVGNGGLVGQVVRVSRHTATVRLITDGQSAVGTRYGPPPGSLAVVGSTLILSFAGTSDARSSCSGAQMAGSLICSKQ